jgi:hypothetical protein
MQEQKRKGTNWSSAIGWVIFLLVVAGGPLLRGLQGLLGNAVQLTNLLPYIVGGLVLLSFAASAVRALAGRGERSSAPRLPESDGPLLPPSRPLPPFGGEAGLPHLPQLPTYATSRDDTSPVVAPPSSYRTPQFDPVLKPAAALVGLLGLVLLGGAAVVVFGGLL